MLDSHLNAYAKGAAFAFDNELILNWYPGRIMNRMPPGGRLLELGIGHGFTTMHFSRHFGRHVVVEGSGAIVSQFQKDHPDCQAEIIEAFFEEFETNEIFDCIVMGFILEHVDSPRQILNRYRKFLAPGGRSFVAVPNAESLHRRIGKAAGMIEDLMSLSPSDLAFGHRRLYSKQSLQAEVEECGYNLLGIEGLFLKPFSTEQLQGLQLTPQVLEALCTVGVNYPELCCALLAEIGSPV